MRGGGQPPPLSHAASRYGGKRRRSAGGERPARASRGRALRVAVRRRLKPRQRGDDRGRLRYAALAGDPLATGALWVQAVSGPAWAGPHPGRGSHGDGRCWSDVVFSDSLTVAYVPSRRAEAAAPPSFRIPLIAHELAPPARQAAACHHDVTCHPGWKSAWGWQSPAIAMLRVERRAGTSQFSGTLVNLELVGDELALLTAAHCVGDAAQARDTVFFWGWCSACGVRRCCFPQ